MRVLSIIIIFSIALLACGQKKERLPIKEQQLIKVLVDVHIAEAAMLELPSNMRDSMGKIYYDQIFKIHHVKEADFNRTMFLLKRQPDQMEEIYNKVADELEKQEKELK